ncbi:MAG: TenA family transcriptional regulator [bacterium]
MNRIEELARLRESNSLLNHPFYKLWTEGKISRETLGVYAREYRAFISALPDGWLPLNEPGKVHEEKEHIKLWNDFAKAFGAGDRAAAFPETRALTAVFQALCESPESAIGALYAFEVQQPAVAQSKADGLRKHYDVSGRALKYFDTHAKNDEEVESLEKKIEALSDVEFERAKSAYALTLNALWTALDGVYFRCPDTAAMACG